MREADPSGLAPLTSLTGVTGISLSHAGSPRVRALAGDPRVTDHFTRGEATWSLSRAARAFFQGNRFLVDPLVDHVVGALHPGAMTDLYAGVGLFSVAAAARGHIPVVAVEGDDVSAQDLRQNTASWKGLLQIRHMPVEEYLRKRRAIHAQTLVLDPPRTGLSKQALTGIIGVRAPRDPVWVADGITADEWEPISPLTGALDAFEWRVPLSAVNGKADPVPGTSSLPSPAPETSLAPPQSAQ